MSWFDPLYSGSHTVSKIQDALRKIQSDRPKAEATEPQVIVREHPEISTTGVLGQIAEEVDDTGIRIIPDDGGLIAVDRQALRSEGYLAPQDQERQMADQYRYIKRPLLENVAGRGSHQADDCNLIMITSSLPGDGKTFTCINLALSMALEKDTTVLLVDADVAKPHVSDLFGVADRPGLIELLKGEHQDASKLVIRTDVPGLRLLPAGKPDEHATELLASRRMTKVIDELSRTYPDRVVIFDSPPLLVTSEARVLASSVGQIALVVRAGKTPQKAVRDAIENLDDSKAINLILNEVDGGFAENYGNYGAYGYGHSDE